MRVSIESRGRFQGFSTVDNSLKNPSEFFFTGTYSSTVTKHRNPAPNSEIVAYKKKDFRQNRKQFLKIEKNWNGNRFAFHWRPYLPKFEYVGQLVRSRDSKLWSKEEKKTFSPKPEVVFKIEKNGNGNQFVFLQRPYIPNFKSLG